MFIGFKAEINFDESERYRNIEVGKINGDKFDLVMSGEFGIWVNNTLKANKVCYKLTLSDKLNSFLIDDFIYSTKTLDIEFFYEEHVHH